MPSKKKGLWSAVLGVIGVILFIASYFISNPQTLSGKIVIILFFVLGSTSMIISVGLGIWGIHTKEKGFLKYTGMLMILLLVLGIAIPLLMDVLGLK